VQLNKIKLIRTQVAAGSVGPGAEVLQREILWNLINSPTHLGRHHDRRLRVVGEEPTDQPLAVAVTVDIRRVQERHSGCNGGAEHIQRRRFAHFTPVCT
jgi:hypothetical protein